ncbi:MAG: UDP-N-acetylmuramoyl-L-alanyl-D-glutamate--2,6-diaminopimelate ligase [Lachnospiraceae bacterium]|nr:UDP-N-acetylmuramoyl-L-alanyl-D-glutamate--2,6-diaminopimelate ligase [Lachnospiraceae bacterium]
MQLETLLKGLDYKCIAGDIRTEIKGLSYDSRKVGEGEVFFCIDGVVHDGHSYAGEVVRKGAAALVVEHEVEVGKDCGAAVIMVESVRYAMAVMSAEYFGNPAKEAVIIGITGTKGKTSISYMIRDMLERTGHKCGIIGTIGAFWGETKVNTGLTTPESYVIHSLFRRMVDDGCGYIVMEVSSQALKLSRTAGIQFDYAVFTNFSPDHICEGEHASLEEYRECKEILFTQCNTGIFNLDDDVADIFIRHAACDTIITFGTGAAADVRADNIRQWNHGGKLGISYEMSGMYEGEVMLEIPGIFNAYNSMAAIIVCRLLGVGMRELTEVLRHVRVHGRVELINVSDEYSVIIDYAHNEVSTRSVLDTLSQYEHNRIICVYGGGGNRSKLRRYDMGEVAGELADLSILTCDNPRDEEICDINNDIKTGLAKHNGKYVEIEDRTDAIAYALRNAVKGDIIVLLGKGHEDYQEIKGVKYHYDEREAVREAAARL